MKTYELVLGSDGVEMDIIYYDENGNEETRELYSQPGFTAEIRQGYSPKQK